MSILMNDDYWKDIDNPQWVNLEHYITCVEEAEAKRKKELKNNPRVSNATRQELNVIKFKLQCPPLRIDEHIKQFNIKYPQNINAPIKSNKRGQKMLKSFLTKFNKKAEKAEKERKLNEYISLSLFGTLPDDLDDV